MGEDIKDIVRFLAKKGGSLDFDGPHVHFGISSKNGAFYNATKKFTDENLFGDIITVFREAKQKAGL